jgi:hypothetical protein
MSDATSVSKGPIIAKILVDLAFYNKLLEYKKFHDDYEENIRKNLKTKVVPNESQPQDNDDRKKGEGASEDSGEEQDIQVGQGLDLKSLIEKVGQGLDLKSVIEKVIPGGDFKTFIGKIVRDCLGEFLKGQVGGGSDNDLISPPSEVIPVEDAQRMSGSIVLKKSDENSKFDENVLLEKVPEKHRMKARELLDSIEDSTSITWNLDGVVFIDGASLPDSNIFKLLPEIFKSNPNKKLPGFAEFVTELANLGHAHLLHKNLLRGLIRNGTIADHSTIYNYIKQKPGNWYYLGI